MGLFRLLSCPSIWERAYEDIAVNDGALTPGVDPTNTLDGFSLERVKRIIASVMEVPIASHLPQALHPQARWSQRPLGIRLRTINSCRLR